MVILGDTFIDGGTDGAGAGAGAGIQIRLLTPLLFEPGGGLKAA